MLSKVENYLNHQLVKQFYDNYKKITSIYPNYPFLNYFGINFDNNGICSFKIYFHLFHKIKEEEISLFLPKTDDFFKYYHLYEPSEIKSLEHSGCAIEIKFKGEENPVIGFHYRLKPIEESYALIGYPIHLPFNMLDVNTRPGINYEYSKNGAYLRKKYYYFDQDEHKFYFSQRFNNLFLNKVHLIEYTESDNFSKLNAWRFDLSNENLNRPNPFSQEANVLFNSLEEKYGLINISDGYYEKSEIRASYFFNIFRGNSDAPFDMIENKNIDTLNLFI